MTDIVERVLAHARATPESLEDWANAAEILLREAVTEIERLRYLNDQIADTASLGLEKLQKHNEVLGKILTGELA